ncbi:AAA family ATPase [Allochromatium palmeri]|nr:AAA family ATPase [Allochromatium palmeri]
MSEQSATPPTTDFSGPMPRNRVPSDTERWVLERVQGLSGCPRLWFQEGATGGWRVDDPDASALDGSDLLGQVDLGRFLAIAESLARLVGAIHERGVIHQALEPACIRVHPEDGRVWILDFSHATTFVERPLEFTSPSRLAGHPAYRSPEQSGRMNRPVDYRTDLYSLGLVLYALATGTPPFEEADPLALMHAHLARDPQPPHERAPWLPHLLSRLILILLAKEPDDRYQSAMGLAHDLQRLRQAVARQEPLAAIRLRTRDPRLSPRPPRRLHGRDQELTTLMEQVRAVTEGQTRALFVAGYSGVGKTALIQEIIRPVTLSRGLFVHGKSEQFQSGRPFLAPARALGRLCEQLLAEPDTRRDAWRRRILTGVGPDVAALFDVIPELATLLGEQAPAPPLDPIETQRRRRALLVALVRQIASAEQPLVLFLDDLQWADPPSLEFIGALLDAEAIGGLLLIGAYRDNEVEAIHPLSALLHRASRLATPPSVLTLESLTLEDLAAVIAEILRQPVQAVHPLAVQLQGKTGGNPFFLVELINGLYRRGLLWLDPEDGRWHWNEAELLTHPVSANLLELLSAELRALESWTIETLVAAAALGNDFGLGRLALATGQSAETLARALMPAIERGILVTADARALQAGRPNVVLRFCHDRMQQAAYQFRDPEARAALHLNMARRFIHSGTVRAHRLSAAEHYAVAVALIRDPAERDQARRLFLQAAYQAIDAGALATGERFLRLALDLLDADDHQHDPELAFVLNAELHQVLYSQGHSDAADAVYQRLSEQADAPLQLVDPTCIQIASLSQRVRHEEAVMLGCSLLERLGVQVPLADLDQSFQKFLATLSKVCQLQALYYGVNCYVPKHLEIRSESIIEHDLSLFCGHLAAGALERLPKCQKQVDPARASIAKLMNRMVYAVNSTGHFLLSPWLLLRLGRLWIEDGYCEASLFPLVALGITIISFRGDYTQAEQLSRTALMVGASREDSRETARSRFVYANCIAHWHHPLEQTLPETRAAFEALMRAADLEFAALTFYATQSAILDSGTQLDDLDAENTMALDFARRIGGRHVEQTYLPVRQLVRALKGQTRSPGEFGDAEFDETTYQAAAAGDPMALAYFHLYRALTACLFQDEATLARHAEIAGTLYIPIACHYATALLNLLLSLTLIQGLANASESERAERLELLSISQGWLAARAKEAPVNFGHLHDLIEAERLAALGDPWSALQVFERAMRNAQAHQRLWHQAFITERAGLCHMRYGLEHTGRALLIRAHQLYFQWGATGKAQAMRRLWPFINASQAITPSWLEPGNLDQTALLRTTELLSTETSGVGLVTRVMELVAQLTGATDVRFLALDEEGHWFLEGGLSNGEPIGRWPLAAAVDQRLVSSSVLRLGSQTQKPVVSDDAVLDSRFAADPYFTDLPLCALLGLPVMVQGRVSAFLMLENRRLRAVFAAERVVELLGGVGDDVPLLQSLRLAAFGGLIALHSVVDARNQALHDAHRTALDQVQQALEMAACEREIRDQQSRFIDLVTHEYRTPLAILKTNLDILTLTQDPNHWRHSLRNMDLAIQRLAEVFDGSLRRDNWGEHRRLHLEPLELVAWLDSCLDAIRASWPDPAPRIDWGAEGTATILADPALLKTVVINLLDNARKYGQPEQPIQVTLTRGEQHARLVVGNHCTASPQLEGAALLKKSVRGANSQGRSGLGMGLYLVNKLVENQEGQVEVRLDQPDYFEIRLSFAIAESEAEVVS